MAPPSLIYMHAGFLRVIHDCIIYSRLNASVILERNETRLKRNETRLERNETRLARNEMRSGNCMCPANGLHCTDLCQLQECTNQPEGATEDLTADDSDVECEDG